jgi:hypothetical protein
MQFQVSILVDGQWKAIDREKPIEAKSRKIAASLVRADSELRHNAKEGCWKVRAV